MGFLDRFRTAPAPTPQPKGGSGRYHTDGFLDYDEFNADLTGPAGLRVFERMWRQDGDVRRDLLIVTTPIAAATWDLDPYVEDEDKGPTDLDLEVCEFVRWNLFESMSPDLPGHLWQAMNVAARSGFAPFEQLYRRDTWQGRPVWALKTLDLRRPGSIDRWEQDGPDLIAVEQFSPGGDLHQAFARTRIPAEDLVYYRLGAEGDNWEGQSLLRPAYKHWLYKDGIEQIEAMGIERWAIGVPVAYPPDAADPADLDAVEEALAGIRANEQGYIVAPGPHAAHAEKGQGWFIETLHSGSGGEGQRVEAALKHHKSAMSAAVLAEFMRLGQDGVGARATADIQQNPFWTHVEAIANTVVQAAVNEQLIPRLVALNYEVKGLPKLRCSLLDSTSLMELGNYVSTLAEQGLITLDPTLEDYLRNVADLPEGDHDAMEAAHEARAAGIANLPAAGDKPPAVPGKPAEQAKPPVDQAPPKDDVEDPKKLSAPVAELHQRAWEQVMSLDAIESAIDGARDQFEMAAGTAARDLALTIARAPSLPRTPVDTTDLADAIAMELQALHETGRHTVREELARQQQQTLPALLAAGDDTPDFEDEAHQAASRIQDEVWAAIVRAGLIRDATEATLQAAAEVAARGALRTQATEHAARALNQGRTQEADDLADLIEGSRYTSILDRRRCSACQTADDDVLRSLDDPVRLARIPPNPACEGGSRCRCLEAFQLKTEAPAIQ